LAPARANLQFPETLEVMQMNDVEAMMLAAANDRVARGAVWLDRACPGWDARLAERLDVGSWETCVLGQLSGDCDLAAEATEHEPAWLIDHGWEDAPDAQPGLSARVAVREQRRVQVDFHPVVFEPAGNGWQQLGDSAWAGFPAGGADRQGIGCWRGCALHHG
jgi:hypothetical protein